MNADDSYLLSKPKYSFNKFLFYFVTLAVLVLIYWRFSEIKLIQEFFAKSNLSWLSVIVVLQVFSYYFQALNYRDVLRVKDLDVSAKKLFPTSFVVQFLNQALPSAGIAGQAFFVQYLKKYGLSLAEGIGRAILELTTLYMAFGVFFVASAIMMFRGDVLGSHPEARFFIYGFLFFAIIAFYIFFSVQRKHRSRLTEWIINKIHAYFENRNNGKKKKSGKNHAGHVMMIFDQFKASLSISELKKRARPFWLAFFWQNMILLANILSLYFLSFAVGFKISFFVAFIAFTLTKFLSMISFVPGALGVFEGGMTLILVTFGVPAQPAFAMTLLLRAFTFWFPMPVGWILYKWILHKQELESPYENSAS